MAGTGLEGLAVGMDAYPCKHTCWPLLGYLLAELAGAHMAIATVGADAYPCKHTCWPFVLDLLVELAGAHMSIEEENCILMPFGLAVGMFLLDVAYLVQELLLNLGAQQLELVVVWAVMQL